MGTHELLPVALSPLRTSVSSKKQCPDGGGVSIPVFPCVEPFGELDGFCDAASALSLLLLVQPPGRNDKPNRSIRTLRSSVVSPTTPHLNHCLPVVLLES